MTYKTRLVTTDGRPVKEGDSVWMPYSGLPERKVVRLGDNLAVQGIPRGPFFSSRNLARLARIDMIRAHVAAYQRELESLKQE